MLGWVLMLGDNVFTKPEPKSISYDTSKPISHPRIRDLISLFREKIIELFERINSWNALVSS